MIDLNLMTGFVCAGPLSFEIVNVAVKEALYFAFLIHFQPIPVTDQLITN